MGKTRAPDPLGLLALGFTTRLHLNPLSKAELGMESISPKDRYRNQESYVLKALIRECNILHASVSHFQSRSINI